MMPLVSLLTVWAPYDSFEFRPRESKGVSKQNDRSFFESRFARREGDAYFTEPWVTRALLSALRQNGTPLSDVPGVVWEPAAGRGDMAKVLMSEKEEVFCSDINLDDIDSEACPWMEEVDFLRDFPARLDLLEVGAIITNPPFHRNYAAKFCQRALDYGVPLVAMLTRLEFASGRTRTDMFRRSEYAFEVKLTNRPRWDWWFRDEPESDPRHYYSWHVWDDRTIGQRPTVFYMGEGGLP